MLTRFSRRLIGAHKFSLPDIKTHNIDPKLVPTEAESTKDELMKYLTDMMTIRRLEILADDLYKNEKIRGFCHLSDGQEAIAVGMEAAVTYEDSLITAYRDHGNAYMRGISLDHIFAELFGKASGSSKGKGGSMHFYHKEHSFYGGNGIVGAQCAIGAGLAFALKYKKKPNVALILFGDGASAQGQLYEASNMAELWKLPAIFVCENNLYGMGTPIEKASANLELYTKGHPSPGIKIDGQNILAVRETFHFAKDYALKNGPIWIECATYRYHGHSMSDPGVSYRKRDEITAARAAKDPIQKVKDWLIEKNEATEEELDKMEKNIRKKVLEIANKAKEEPWPDHKELFTDVYGPGRKYFYRNIEFKNSTMF
ncbi:unnamed protein product [Blepharisma stoltei]|uniref:Pyruvate dehydrogenase E1 component subunit alpha n=1 Tax=Blepharisma stoltei TaxID=1481888 RepID=A0AAU9IIC6_9CILI|nr:unnamed protein product [Blepharisma stoltei]